MAGYDVERKDPLTYFRTEVLPADLARAKADWQAQAQRDHQAAVVGWTVMAAIALLLALAVLIHRRKIARAADAAIVSGLASGVRAARKARTKRSAWFARVLAKADEPTPPRT